MSLYIKVKTMGEITKVCVDCKLEKDISDFSKKYKTKAGIQKHSTICKKCFNIKDAERRKTKEYQENKSKYLKEYYDENRDKILEQKKEYHIQNRDKILNDKVEYRKIPENRERAKEYISNNRYKYRDAQKKYRRNNPHIIAWRNMLHRTLSHLDTIKEDNIHDMLGYSAVELKHHIAKQFIEGMTWGNHGEWEIDHIKPLTKFNSDSHPCEVNALSNLQPLWKEDNLRKSNKY